MACWLYANWQLILEIIVPFGVAGMLLKIFLSKPKVVFCEARIGSGYEESHSICWYVPIMNLRRDNWLRHFCQREAAVDCRVKVRFTKVDGELIYNYALWWNDSLIGETLEVNSKPREFPLAFEDNEREVYLAGTPITTASSPIPNYRIPFPIDVLAYVELSSKKKVIAKSKWLIEIKHSYFTPVNVKRLECK